MPSRLPNHTVLLVEVVSKQKETAVIDRDVQAFTAVSGNPPC